MKCATWHRMVFFFDTQLAKKCHQMVCIGQEGKMEVCPHRQVSLGDQFNLFKGKKSGPLPCAECEVLFRADRGEKCSTLVASGDVGSVRLRIMAEWTMEVCHLAEGQVVTKDLIRQGLEDLEARFGNQFLCPHLTFRDQKLMVPFEWERCVCFRDPTPAESRECYQHDHNYMGGDPTCCACRARKHPEAVGRLMAPRKSGRQVPNSVHDIVCRHCRSHYRWGVRGDSITISRSHCRGKIFARKTKKDTLEAFRLAPVKLQGWILRLGPSTYHENQQQYRRHTYCVDKSCWNSRQRQMCSKGCLSEVSLSLDSNGWY